MWLPNQSKKKKILFFFVWSDPVQIIFHFRLQTAWRLYMKCMRMYKTDSKKSYNNVDFKLNMQFESHVIPYLLNIDINKLWLTNNYWMRLSYMKPCGTPINSILNYLLKNILWLKKPGLEPVGFFPPHFRSKLPFFSKIQEKILDSNKSLLGYVWHSHDFDLQAPHNTDWALEEH